MVWFQAAMEFSHNSVDDNHFPLGYSGWPMLAPILQRLCKTGNHHQECQQDGHYYDHHQENQRQQEQYKETAKAP